MSETTKIRKRSEIPVEDTWALEDLYVTDEAWEQELATLSEDEKVLTSFAGKLGEGAENLYAYMERPKRSMPRQSSLPITACARQTRTPGKLLTRQWWVSS